MGTAREESLSLARQIDEACDRFEADWKAGRRPRIEAFLSATVEAERSALLGALLSVELELLREAGRSPSLNAYLQRFPEHADDFLKGVKHLSDLHRDKSRMGDTSLRHLKVLTRLYWLDVSYSQVTDAGLECLAGLANLLRLDLNNTCITDGGLAHLKGLTNLTSLGLHGTQITDAGLLHLGGLTQLRRISLNLTQVTDAGLAHLRGLTRLDWLGVYGTQVTSAGIAALNAVLPFCRVLK